MADEDVKKNDTDDSADFIATARKRFEVCVEEEAVLREEAAKNQRFVAGDQWEPQIKTARINAGRPAMTFNRCHTFVQQVSNEARQNKPQIKFVPAEDGDKELAEVYEGLARHIQYDSDAQVAYETAVENSAGAGWGFYRFVTEYCDDESFDQDLKIKPVTDSFAVYGIVIPACLGIEPSFAFVVSHLSKDEYKTLYPDSEMASIEWADDRIKACGSWAEDKIRIAEYWVVESKSRELKKGKNVRTVIEKTVKCYKINGMEVLEEQEWAGYCIPIIPVLGKLMFVDGAPRLFSVVSHQRDAQNLINVYKSRIGETLLTAPIQPYIVAKGSIPAENRGEWETLNSTQRPYLTYDPVAANGLTVPPPQRQVFEAPIASLSEAAAQEIDDMKATAGIYDASLGAKSNETSGVALQRRQQQSNVTNLHFMDNLERAFKRGGLVIADLLDKIYDTERRIRILGQDETPKIVAINQQNQDGKNYKFGSSKFDVIVTMGRSFSTKRMESFDMMTSVIQANPDVFNLIGDLFFKNSDLAGADQLADRFKMMLPPQVQQAEQKEGQQPDPQALMAENQQLKMQGQQMQQELQQAQQPMQVEQVRQQSAQQMKQAELASNERIQMAKFQHELELKNMEIQSQHGIKGKEIQGKISGEVMKHDSNEAMAEHKFEQEAALEIYKTEAMLKSKQIDRDAAQQQQEMAEDKSTAEAM
jgi:hypothetical protein